jgi:predicted NUDIX family NTP pyrophosphohydrolase
LLYREKSEVISILLSSPDNFYGQDSVVWSLTPSGVYTI